MPSDSDSRVSPVESSEFGDYTAVLEDRRLNCMRWTVCVSGEKESISVRAAAGEATQSSPPGEGWSFGGGEGGVDGAAVNCLGS